MFKTQVEGVEKSVEEVKVTEQTSSTTTTPQPEPEISSKIPKITFELPKPKQEAAMPTSELLKKTANSSTAGTTTLIDYEDSEAEKKGDKDPKTLIEQV
jgi:hypothetical protein